MAQIITKYSTSSGNSPGGLTTGELAVNISDKKLYVGGVAGTVSLSDSYVTSFNGRTGAVQGVSAANGLTGSVTFQGSRGITHSVGGNGISFSIDFKNGGLTFPSNGVVGPNDILLLQTSVGLTMYTATVNDVITSNIQTPTTEEFSGAVAPQFSFIQFNEGNNISVDYNLVKSGLISVIDGGTFSE